MPAVKKDASHLNFEKLKQQAAMRGGLPPLPHAAPPVKMRDGLLWQRHNCNNGDAWITHFAEQYALRANH